MDRRRLRSEELQAAEHYLPWCADFGVKTIGIVEDDPENTFTLRPRWIAFFRMGNCLKVPLLPFPWIGESPFRTVFSPVSVALLLGRR